MVNLNKDEKKFILDFSYDDHIFRNNHCMQYRYSI